MAQKSVKFTGRYNSDKDVRFISPNSITLDLSKLDINLEDSICDSAA